MSLKQILYTLLVCVAATLMFAACKKDKKKTESPASDESIENMASLLNTQQGAALTFATSMKGGKDSLDAFIDMVKWVLQQPDVSKAFVTNASILRIEYKSGLEGFVVTSAIDAQGNPYFRGGGGGSGSGNGGRALQNLYKSTADDFVIENKKVLVFSPFFPPEFDYHQKLQNGKIKLEATLVEGANADLDVLNTFKDYGLVVINTHGLPHGFTLKCKVESLSLPQPPSGRVFTRDEVRAMFLEANGLPMDKFVNKELSLTQYVFYAPGSNVAYTDARILVRDKYIRNMPHLDKAIVFGNFCYSGFSYDGPDRNNIAQAFKSIGAVVFYGYAFSDGSSAIVPNPWASYLEDSLITNLIDGDSAGIAHLKEDGSLRGTIGHDQISVGTAETEATLDELNRGDFVFTPRTTPVINDFGLRHFLDPRYKYDCGCGTITDDRDGQKYRYACIGSQTWLAENLRWAGAGVCYGGNTTNCEKYGRLYTVQEATGLQGSTGNPSGIRGICPQGWHVPSQTEVLALCNALGGTDNAVHWLRSKEGWPANPAIKDSFCFGMLPAGLYTDNNSFEELGGSGEFWMTRVDEGSTPGGPLHYYTFKIQDDDITVGEYQYDPGLNMTAKVPCRCVKD